MGQPERDPNEQSDEPAEREQAGDREKDRRAHIILDDLKSARLEKLELRPGVIQRIVEQLLDRFTDRAVRFLRRLLGGLQHQSSSSSSLERPALRTRATTKPTTAAAASEMPGLSRTKLRVSSISSSGSFSAIAFATFSMVPAARRA